MKALFTSIGHNLRRLGDFSGRQTQIQFWPYAGLVYGLATFVGMMIMMVPIANIFFRAMTDIRAAAEQGSNVEPAFVKAPETLFPDFGSLLLPIVLVNLVTIALLAAAVARRLHDKDRTAWWGLLPLPGMAIGLALMPTDYRSFMQDPPDPRFFLLTLNNFAYLGLFVLLVVLLIGVGTSGPNRFGPEITIPD